MTEAPVLQFGFFLADLGPTPQSGVQAWVTRFKELIRQAEPLGTAVVTQVRVGRTGRVFLEVMAVDPDAAVNRAWELADREGPRVTPL